MEGTKNQIVCKVTECEYHDKTDDCTAPKVEVGGENGRCNSSCDTECVTFKPCK